MEVLKIPLTKRKELIKSVYSEDFVYTLEDCRWTDSDKADVMYARLEQQRLKEIAAIETTDNLLAFLKPFREQILSVTWGLDRTHFVAHHMRALNDQLLQKVRDVGLEGCKETDILFDREAFEKRSQALSNWKRWKDEKKSLRISLLSL